MKSRAGIVEQLGEGLRPMGLWWLSLWLLLGLTTTQAQDISGYWQGMERDSNSLANPYPTSLTIVQNGNTFSGFYYQSMAGTPQYNVLFAIEKGQFVNYEGSFEINVPIQQHSLSGGFWCTGLITFTYNPERQMLRAKTTYKQCECTPSVVELYRARLKAKDPFCPTDIKDLYVIGFDVHWYADPQGQVLLQEGSAYRPTLDSTTTFYITQGVLGSETPTVPVVINVNKMTIANPASVEALCATGKGQLTVDATGKQPLLYSLDSSPYQSSPSFELIKLGSHLLTVKDSSGCQTTQAVEFTNNCENNIFLPTAFSPNGDGVNDELSLWFGLSWLRLEAFSIFDRWGRLLYHDEQSRTLQSGQALWSSQASGAMLLPGVYAYRLQVITPAGQPLTLENSLTVIK
ncbi:T9SS type B sorting domain-containing protein [Spirosoma lituiforme]